MDQAPHPRLRRRLDDVLGCLDVRPPELLDCSALSDPSRRVDHDISARQQTLPLARRRQVTPGDHPSNVAASPQVEPEDLVAPPGEPGPHTRADEA